MFNVNSEFSLNIELDNGLYWFISKSGIGKTYLANVIIPSLQDIGYHVRTITYHKDYTEYEYLLEIKKAIGYNVVVVDKYERYISDKITQALNILSKGTTVLVDIKKLREGFNPSNVAYIDFNKESMRVYGCTIRR